MVKEQPTQNLQMIVIVNHKIYLSRSQTFPDQTAIDFLSFANQGIQNYTNTKLQKYKIAQIQNYKHTQTDSTTLNNFD